MRELGGLDAWFDQNLDSATNMTGQPPWSLVFGITIWSLWNIRNKHVFQQ